MGGLERIAVDNTNSDRPNPARDGYLQKWLNEVWDLPEFACKKVTGINDKSIAGNIPLHIAAVRGDLRAIEALILAGSSVNARGEHGYTPLHEAAEQGHMEAAKILIGAGSSLSILNDDSLPPAALATASGNQSLIDLFKNIPGPP